MGNAYWTTGRSLTPKEAENSLCMAARGEFVPGRNEPNWDYVLSGMTTTKTAATTTTTTTTVNPRRRGSGDFQKEMLFKDACDLPDDASGAREL